MNNNVKNYGLYPLIGTGLWFFFKTNKPTKIINFASKWIDVHTDKKNIKFSNAEMEKLIKAVGWSQYDQWCMDFAKMCYYNAYINDPTMRQKIQNVFTGSTQESFNNVLNKTTPFKITTTPKPGDILIFQRSTDKTSGHAGIITKVINDKYVNTIEGNTGSDQGNGHYVARKKRPYTKGAGIGQNLYVRGIITMK